MNAARPADVENVYPLTPAQSAMLFHNLSAPGSGVYIEQVFCDLRERVDIGVLNHAWQWVVQRHAALRTRFQIESSDQPSQEVLRHADVPITREDWTNVDATIQASRFARYCRDDLLCDFDLSTVPMRLKLFQFGSADYRLVWTFHHALLDGRSTRQVLRELFDCYDASINGRELALPSPPCFGDYVRWLKQQETEEAKKYWQQSLAGVSATPLVIEREKSSRQHGQAVLQSRLSSDLSENLRSFTKAHGLSMNSLLQAAWAHLLSRYNSSDDVVFAATRALRASSFDRVREVIGVLVNTVPMRVAVRDEMPTLEWLKCIRAQWIEMRPLEHASLADILRWSGVPAQPPLLSSLVTCEHSLLNSDLSRDYKLRGFRSSSVTDFPLAVLGFAEPRWTLKIAYQQSRFDQVAVQRMLDHLCHFFQQVVESPSLPIGSRSLLTDPEWDQLLCQWQAGTPRFPVQQCVHRLFEQQVKRAPDSCSVICLGIELTFGELNRRANKLAHYLRRAGVERDRLVGICLPRSPDVIIAMLAIQKAGGAYLCLDADNPQQRLEAMIADAQPVAIITAGEQPSCGSVRELPTIDLVRDAAEIARQSGMNLDCDVSLDDLAYAVFTSGSTGQPKGILIPHRALTNHTLALIDYYDISAADKRLQLASLSSDVLIAEVFPYLAVGGTVVMAPPHSGVSITRFLDCIDQEKVTVVGMPSALWHEWVMTIDQGGEHAARTIPPSLRIVVAGMDRVRPDLLAIWEKRVAGPVRWFNAYGPSEATCTTTIYEAPRSAETDVLDNVPIGRPIAGARVILLDQKQRPVPGGVPGEICIGGCGLARGYLNNPELTKQKFIDICIDRNTSQRLYRTGDLGRYREDGNIEFLGRTDHQIKLRGYRIELGEIESVLMSHPAIRDCAVIMYEDSQHDKRLVAYTAAVDGVAIETAALKADLRRQLPEYMVPTAFVTLPELPRTPNGKVDRCGLPTPGCESLDSTHEVVAAKTPTQRRLVGLWQDIMKLDQVGIHDDFFQSGGHSLLALRLMHRIEQDFGKSLPVTWLFSTPTIEGLARAIDEAGWEHESKTGQGTTPLFVVPPLGPLFLAPLSKIISRARPFHVLPPRGLQLDESPLFTVEEMAAHQLNRLRRVSRNGPYLLAGRCFGAFVAFEMAQQLTAQGEIVAGLIVLDSAPPYSIDRPVAGRNLKHSRRERAMHLIRHRRWSALGASVARTTGTKMRRFHNAIKVKSTGLVKRFLSSPEQRHLDKLELANWQAHLKYQAKPFSGRIVLIRSEEFSALQEKDTHLHWQSLAQGGFESVEVPGTHLSMFRQPQVQELARQIARASDSMLVDR